jgi:hypothetical protein
VSGASVDGDSEALALTLLTQVADDLAGTDSLDRKKLNTAVQAKLMRGKVPIGQHRGVLDLVKDDNWLTRVSSEDENSPVYSRISVDSDAGTVMFAAKE